MRGITDVRNQQEEGQISLTKMGDEWWVETDISGKREPVGWVWSIPPHSADARPEWLARPIGSSDELGPFPTQDAAAKTLAKQVDTMTKPRMRQPALIEIDLSQTTCHGGAGLEVGPTYLVLYSGRLYAGRFSQVWYGLNFNGIYDAGAQYDPPGANYSSWQRIWRIDNADAICREAEPEYKARRRAYAIAHKLKSNGQTIDESAPLEAFGYYPTVSPMPDVAEF